LRSVVALPGAEGRPDGERFDSGGGDFAHVVPARVENKIFSSNACCDRHRTTRGSGRIAGILAGLSKFRDLSYRVTQQSACCPVDLLGCYWTHRGSAVLVSYQ